MVMASCDNFDLPNPPGQTNPEPDGIFENSGLVLEQGEATVNLVEANAANQNVNVANVTELINFPADYTLAVDMLVSGDASFSKFATVSTTLVDNAVMVNPDIFNGAIQEVLTKKPGTYDIHTRFAAYAERGTTRMRLGGLDAFYGSPAVFQVKTLDPAKVLEEAYYLVPCDASGKPAMAKAVRMNNTLGDISSYDNPVFAIKTEVTSADIDNGGYRWMIAPQSAVTAGNTDGVLGCNPSPASDLAGKLGAGYAPGVITLLGDVLVTVNVLDDSYTVNYAFETLYPFSGRTSADKVMRLYTDNYINYTGVTAINQRWTLGAQPDKNGPVIFRQDPNSEQETNEETGAVTGKLTNLADGTDIRAPFAGNCLYWVEVNLVELDYSISAIETLSVIGSGNEWDLATATELKPSSDKKIWTAENVVIGDEFKINANGAWTIGFSGTSVPDATGKQVYNVNKQDGGANLQAVPGTYKVTLDFSTKPYTVVLE